MLAQPFARRTPMVRSRMLAMFWAAWPCARASRPPVGDVTDVVRLVIDSPVAADVHRDAGGTARSGVRLVMPGAAIAEGGTPPRRRGGRVRRLRGR